MYYQNCSTCFEEEYRKILREIISRGRNRHVRGFKTRELSPFSWTTSYPLRNVLTNPVRKINKGFMAAEFLWIMSGRNDTEMIATYNSQLSRFSDNSVVFRGAYGPMIQRQLEYVYYQLRKDLNTRQAVINIWQPNPGNSKDIPCTLSLQFLHDETIGALDLIASMRSNDAWLGLPYDVFNFTMILNYMAMKLGLKVGRYTHNVGSEHLYDNHYEIAVDAGKDIDCRLSDIEESTVFESDQLLETMHAEQKMRSIYATENFEKLNVLALTYNLGPGWKELIEKMFSYLMYKRTHA